MTFVINMRYIHVIVKDKRKPNCRDDEIIFIFSQTNDYCLRCVLYFQVSPYCVQFLIYYSVFSTKKSNRN